MTVASERKEEILHGLAMRNADRLEDALLAALDKGWLLFHKGKPRERRVAYMKATLEPDLQYVTDPDYLEKLSLGMAPELMAVQMLHARADEIKQIESLAQPDPMTGQLVPATDPMTGQELKPQIPDPPMFWPLIIALPPYVFEKLSRDFRDLMKDLAA